MKQFYTMVALAITSLGFAQTTIYSENMGTGTATTAISATTFQNANITYSGTGDVRSSNASTTGAYLAASGGANVMLNATGETFIVEGINTSGYLNITMSFGQRKGTTAANNEMTVEVSSDGTSWSPLSYSRPTGTGTAIWAYITPTGTIPATANLRLRFTSPSAVEWRIDDILIQGEVDPLANAQNDIEGLNVYPNPANDFVTISSNNLVEKQVALFDVTGKNVMNVVTNETINVSDLQAGVYVMKITENGKTATRKLIVK